MPQYYRTSSWSTAGLFALAIAASAMSAKADPASDEANRQNMMADMRASAAANDRANFDSQQRQQADAARYNGSGGNSGSSGSSNGSSSSSSDGTGSGSYRSDGPRSIVASYTFTVHRQESPAALTTRLETEATAGNALSAFNLGRIFYTGFDGIPRNDANARRWFGEAAKLGHPGAQSQFGYMLHDGVGGPVDAAGALDWLKKSAEQGDTYGQALYGFYRVSAYRPNSAEDLTAPISYLTQAADKGQLVAQMTLGTIVYDLGVGTPINRDKAAHYARLAADQGQASAQATMGRFYVYGEGVPQDYTLGVAWLRKAATQNNSEAILMLGQLEMEGLGLPKDETAGAQLVKQAADAGNMAATGMYGVYLQQGYGVPKDEITGARMLKVAAESHDGVAEQNYAIALFNGQGVASDEAAGVTWQKRAADDGNIAAAATYGVRLMHGKGVATDYAEGLRYARIAAAADNSRGQTTLGFAYWYGWGVPKDPAKALEWLRKGAAQGDADAIALLPDIKAADGTAPQ